MVDAALVRKARQADLAQYLLSVGVPLVRAGGRHVHKAHDSLVIKGNMYYWNSRGCRGNSLDFLMRHMGMEFRCAVSALTGFVPVASSIDNAAVKKDYGVAPNFRHLFAYLIKTRGISAKLVQSLVSKKLLVQESGTANAVFKMVDENGDEVGAELNGTLSGRRFKGVRAGSKHGYGFNLRIDAKPARYILFFESAVDLLSFVDLKTGFCGKTLAGCLLVSMCGLKPGVVSHMSGIFGGQPILCPDNDGAGERFLAACAHVVLPCGSSVKAGRLRPEAGHKDWNDWLKAVKKVPPSFFPAPHASMET